MDVLLLVLSAAMVLWGADRLTDSASVLARRFGISEMVIGLTIVAMGTSLPELVISMSGILMGSSDISVGNIVGSNLFNVLVIVGVSAMVSPIAIARATLTKDIPFALLAALALSLAAWDGVISRTDGLTLLLFFAVFVWYTMSIARTEGEQSAAVQWPLWKCLVYAIAGIAALVLGGDMFVDAASGIAMALGVSELVVGLTIVAAGTSLPELATSIVAARKGHSALAVGNVIGSNLFNVFMVMGISSTIRPVPTSGLSLVDQLLLCVSVIVMWIFAATSSRLSRIEGALMSALYVGYMIYLIW